MMPLELVSLRYTASIFQLLNIDLVGCMIAACSSGLHRKVVGVLLKVMTSCEWTSFEGTRKEGEAIFESVDLSLTSLVDRGVDPQSACFKVGMTLESR